VRHPAQRVQRGLEQVYRLPSGPEVCDFMIDEERREALDLDRRPREQLLLHEDGDDLNIALFLDPASVDTLRRHDPGRRLDHHNWQDFLLVLEGVSHFVYAVHCANHNRAVSQLELELQAEVDKYVTCLLVGPADREASVYLRQRLFREIAYDDELSAEEHERYRVANDQAHRYALHLEEAFVTPRKIPEMLGQLRTFYRQSIARKLELIAQAA
jgi:hypothetical protein